MSLLLLLPNRNETVTTTSWLFASAHTESSGSNPWTNPSNSYTSNDVRGTCTIAASSESNYMYWYAFSGLSIPPDATILGIEARFEVSVTAGSLAYTYFYLNNSDAFDPGSVDVRGIFPTGTEALHIAGNDDDKWGGVDTDGSDPRTFNRNWQPSDFSSTFCISGAFGADTSGATVSVDSVSLRVRYSQPVGGSSTITAAAGVGTTSTITGSSTAVSTPSTAAGAGTSSTLVGRATVAASITAAAGASTASTLAGAGVTTATSSTAAGTSTASTLTASSTAATTPSPAAGSGTASALTGSSTAVSAPSTAAGVGTTSAVAGRSAAAASITSDAGTATTSALQGIAVAIAVPTQAAGTSTTNTQTGSSTAVSTIAAAAGAATASTFEGSSTAQTSPATASGAATAQSLQGLSTANAAIDGASGAGTTNALAGSSTAQVDLEPAAGVSATSTMSSDSGTVVTASIDPATGQATTSTLAGVAITGQPSQPRGYVEPIRIEPPKARIEPKSERPKLTVKKPANPGAAKQVASAMEAAERTAKEAALIAELKILLDLADAKTAKQKADVERAAALKAIRDEEELLIVLVAAARATQVRGRLFHAR